MNRPVFRLILPLVLVLTAGGVFTRWLVEQADQEMRADLIQQTRLLAQGLNVEQIAVLAGSAPNPKDPIYQRIKEQLTLVRSTYPFCRFIYLTARKPDGSIVFVADSEPEGTPAVSPPGQVYAEASKQFRDVFDHKTSIAEGPLPDRWGVWTSALVPVIDAQTGTPVAVLGMDVDARDWNWNLARAALPAALLALALAAILLTGMLLVDRRSRTRGSPAGWMRHIEVGSVGAVGVILSLAAAWLAYMNVSRRRDDNFAKLAGNQTAAMVEKLQGIRDNQLESLAHFYAARDQISAGEFEEFAQSLTRNPTATIWGWAPVVTAAERDRFEATARASGLANFEIWQTDPEGKRVRASGRDTYYPVFQVAPSKGNELFVGRDSASEPLRRAALEEAIRTRLTTGTDPVTVPSASGNQKGIIAYRPVFARDNPNRLRGLVGAVVRLETLLQTSVFLDRIPLMELSLLHKGAAPETLATTWSGDRPPAIGRPATRPLFAFGKVLVVTTHPGPEFARDDPLRAGGLSLMFGLVLTGTVATITRLTLRQRARLERLVGERTTELRQSEESYRNQFANNSVAMLLIDSADGKILDANAAALGYYGYPLEKLRTMHIFDLTLREPDKVRQLATAITKGEQTRLESRHRLADGTVRDVAVASSSIQYGGRAVIHCIIQDITEQKHAQEALRESAERYRSIISVSNTGAWEYYSDTGDFWASPEYFGMLGRSHATLDSSRRQNLQEDWVELLHPEDREAASAHFAEYLRQGSVGMYESYFRMRHRDGEWIWIWARGQTLRDANGQPTHQTIGTHIDITERKKAAVQLETAHANLQERLKEMRCLYAISKLTAQSDRPVADLFAAAVELIPPAWQYPEIARARITFRGQVFASPGFQTTAWTQSADIAIAGETTGTVEVCYLGEVPSRPGGPFLPEEQTLLANIAIQFGVMIERRQAEENLRRLSGVIEQAPLSVIIINLERMIDYVNPRFCAVTGYTKDEVVGRPVAVIGTRELQPDTYAELSRAVNAKEVWTGELRSRRKNGELFLEYVVVAPLVDDRGQITHFVSLKDDITAQKRSEAELAKERELSEMKSQFISVASHEFRTPLAAAVGSLELLERHAAKLTEAKRVELLGRIQRSLSRLTAIMDDVLQLSRADSGRVKVNRMTVDLVQFVQDIIQEVSIGDRQQHRFVFEQTGGPGVVPVDTKLLHHIISNLAGNAARYSPAGTEVSVRLDLGAEEFALTVADEGIGVPEAEKDRIFEPFVRGSNVGQIGGTGLGLNIVKRYTELMGGRIELLPTARGAAFRVHVPCCPNIPSA